MGKKPGKCIQRRKRKRRKFCKKRKERWMSEKAEKKILKSIREK